MTTTTALRLAALVAAALSTSACGLIGGGGRGDGPAPRGTSRTVSFVNAQGQPAGTATLTTVEGGIFISAQLRNLPEGTHGFHVHQTGSCQAPSFESAGGHLNPTSREHGFLNPRGEHAGDLPNITIRSDGTAAADAVARGLVLGSGANGLLDDDGSALVVHAGVDDYRTEPSGNSGPRIACAIVR